MKCARKRFWHMYAFRPNRISIEAGVRKRVGVGDLCGAAVSF